MASAVSTQKVFSQQAIAAGRATGTAGTVLCPTTFLDLRDFDSFAVIAMLAAKTGNGITKLEIVAAEDSAGSSNLTVIKDSGTVAADALGDYVVQECTAAEIAQLGRASGYALRYVAARVTLHNAADVAAVTMIRGDAKVQYKDMTANYISA